MGSKVVLMILSFIFACATNGIAGDYLSLCDSPEAMEKAVEYHTRVSFPNFANDEAAFSNVKALTKDFVETLCVNVGKRAYHGAWHPEPFDFGKIVGVTYF